MKLMKDSFFYFGREIQSWGFIFIYIQMMYQRLIVLRVLVMPLDKENLSVMLFLMLMGCSRLNHCLVVYLYFSVCLFPCCLIFSLFISCMHLFNATCLMLLYRVVASMITTFLSYKFTECYMVHNPFGFAVFFSYICLGYSAFNPITTRICG